MLLEQSLEGPPVLDRKYRLERRLGQGGMGVVYRATHEDLHRPFALKLLRATRARNNEFLGRFRVEAEALGKLKHPHVVDVTDFGVDPRAGGVAYLVMEHLEGHSLEEHCRRKGPLDLDDALPMLSAMAQAVDFAHEHGVLHRDLKPANVFLAGDGDAEPVLKILDFGLARLVGDSEPSSPEKAATPDAPSKASDLETRETLGSDVASGPTLDIDPAGGPRRLTEPGSLGGTPVYMAPELFTGGEASRASDIYALGVLAYEMLVGAPPFRGSFLEVHRGHVEGKPAPPSAARAALPPEIDRPLLQALEKQKERRPASAAGLVAGLRQASRAAKAREFRSREVPRRAWISVAAAAVLVAITGLLSAGGFLRGPEARTVDLRFAATSPRAPDPRLLLVLLDDASLEADPTPLSAKADEVGQTLGRVFAAGARAVAIDLLLPKEWSTSAAFSRLVLEHESGLTLAAASAPGGAAVGPECLAGLTATALGPDRAAGLFGFVNLVEDPDGVVRRGRTRFRDATGRERDSLPGRAARTLLGSAPKDAGEAFWIDHSADWQRLPRVSWKDLGTTLESAPETFRDRLVLVGADFSASGDEMHRVPARGEGPEAVAGVVLQALMVDTLLARTPVREASPLPIVVGAGVLAALVLLGLLCSPRPLGPVLLAVFAALVYVGTAFALFERSRLLIPVVAPLLVVSLALALGFVLRSRLSAIPPAESEAP